jgi:flagellar assembly protein FliH
LSKIIKANPDRAGEVMPYDFVQLKRREGKDPSRPTNMLGTLINRTPETDSTRGVQPSVQNLLLNAERKAQELEEQAYQKGYEQGQKDGFEFGQRSMAIVKEHLEGLFEELQCLPETLLKEYREWLIEMCLSISRRIVRRELATDSGQLSQLIDNLLREAVDEHTLTIHVHPDDLDLMEKHLDLTSLAERSGRTFSLRADANLERGGCRLESDVQLLDASIEKQFSIIEQALKKDEPISDHILT